MNVWMDIAIPALVFAAGCLAVAIWALREMYRHKRAYAIANESATKYLAERDEALRLLDGVQPKLDGMTMAIRDQAQRNAQVIAERDSLRSQLDEALKSRRTSRAKPKEVP